MLQQTQVKTVIPYFNKFIKKHKTLESLSKINENQILKLQKSLQCLVNSESIDISKVGNAQNLKDKEIIEFLGDD